MSSFKIVDITPCVDQRLFQFSHPFVSAGEGVNEWLGFRMVWVLNRARRSAPAPQSQLFRVTHEGQTRTVEIVDKVDMVEVSLL